MPIGEHEREVGGQEGEDELREGEQPQGDDDGLGQ